MHSSHTKLWAVIDRAVSNCVRFRNLEEFLRAHRNAVEKQVKVHISLAGLRNVWKSI